MTTRYNIALNQLPEKPVKDNKKYWPSVADYRQIEPPGELQGPVGISAIARSYGVYIHLPHGMPKRVSENHIDWLFDISGERFDFTNAEIMALLREGQARKEHARTDLT
jgi:hypothetical protein